MRLPHQRFSCRDKPVIRKALVELDGPVFGAYKELRQRWAAEDAYRCSCMLPLQLCWQSRVLISCDESLS